MFKMTTDIKNSTDKILLNIEAKAASYQNQIGVMSTAISEYINVRLKQIFGESLHFVAHVEYLSEGVFQVKISADEIGVYLYYGTSSHRINSIGAMPIGEGRFAHSVNHPGTAARQPEIDAIIQEALISVRAGNYLWHY